MRISALVNLTLAFINLCPALVVRAFGFVNRSREDNELRSEINERKRARNKLKAAGNVRKAALNLRQGIFIK